VVVPSGFGRLLKVRHRLGPGAHVARGAGDSSFADGTERGKLEGGRSHPLLIHHSDRGIHYASGDYTELLEQAEIQISMSRRGNPYDNARAERFMRTLKEEEVYGADYRNLEDARSRIGESLEQTYNRQRLHSALRYLTPEEFERASLVKESDGADGSGGNQRQVYHRSHRPWKSLQDFHTPAAQQLLIYKRNDNGRSVTN
jgi:Integrase core domain